MFASRLSLPYLPFALATVALALLAVPDLPAQSPQIPPGTRMYKRFQLEQRALRQAHAQATVAQPSIPVVVPHRPTASTLNVSVNVPTSQAASSATPTTYVTIRGPDGEVRRFPLARGVEVQYRRQSIVVHAGESTTIRLIPR